MPELVDAAAHISTCTSMTYEEACVSLIERRFPVPLNDTTFTKADVKTQDAFVFLIERGLAVRLNDRISTEANVRWRSCSKLKRASSSATPPDCFNASQQVLFTHLQLMFLFSGGTLVVSINGPEEESFEFAFSFESQSNEGETKFGCKVLLRPGQRSCWVKCKACFQVSLKERMFEQGFILASALRWVENGASSQVPPGKPKYHKTTYNVGPGFLKPESKVVISIDSYRMLQRHNDNMQVQLQKKRDKAKIKNERNLKNQRRFATPASDGSSWDFLPRDTAGSKGVRKILPKGPLANLSALPKAEHLPQQQRFESRGEPAKLDSGAIASTWPNNFGHALDVKMVDHASGNSIPSGAFEQPPVTTEEANQALVLQENMPPQYLRVTEGEARARSKRSFDMFAKTNPDFAEVQSVLENLFEDELSNMSQDTRKQLGKRHSQFSEFPQKKRIRGKPSGIIEKENNAKQALVYD